METEIAKLFKEIEEMVNEKNLRYGDSIGKSCAMLYMMCPEGITTKQYPHAHYVIRILDKVSRIMALNIGQEDIQDAYRDIIGYSVKALQQWG